MKTKLFILIFAVVLSTRAEEAKTPPAIPADITLISGRVLRNIEVLRWDRDRVVVRWSGGVEIVPFALSRTPTPAELLAIRDASKKSQIANVTATRAISGQVFVVTRGRDNRKMGDLNVYIVPKLEMDSWLASHSIGSEYVDALKGRLVRFGNTDLIGNRNVADRIIYEYFESAPQGEIKGHTDADGKFSVLISVGKEFYAFARANRSVAGDDEWYVWLHVIEPRESAINLSNSDLWRPKE